MIAFDTDLMVEILSGSDPRRRHSPRRQVNRLPGGLEVCSQRSISSSRAGNPVAAAVHAPPSVSLRGE